MLYPSKKHTYDKQTGPFQPVRLIVNVDSSWSLQCPVYEHVIIKSGKLQESVNGAIVDLGLKYAFVWRDNWTRLNVKPAKIMQVIEIILQNSNYIFCNLLCRTNSRPL